MSSNSRLFRPVRANARRPCHARAFLLPVCIHKEYSKRGIEPTQRPSSSILLTTPEDIVIECLTLMRKGELSELAPYIPRHLLASQGAAVHVAGVPVHEQGPLAGCAPFMDTAARRVLPGHLLRRARIQSSLQLGGSCLLRVSLTACTGEEVLLNWKLGLVQLPGLMQQQQQQQSSLQPTSHVQHTQQPSHHGDSQTSSHSLTSSTSSKNSSHSMSDTSISSSSSSSSASWQVLSCERDKSSDEDLNLLPKGPHPRTSPELVVLAQLHALRQDDIMGACGFNILGRHAAGSGWDTHFTAFRNLLKQPHYQLLASHRHAELGGSALPSQRHFLQEVMLYEGGGWENSGHESSSSSGRHVDVPTRGLAGRFLWRLGMQADGCWMVRSIEAL